MWTDWRSADPEALTAALVAAPAGEGTRFVIPIVVPEGVPTGDGRVFKPMALSYRDLPIPLLWQTKTADGHDGSVVIGRIDGMERISNGLGNAYGVLDTSPDAMEAERMMRGGFLRGVSADLDNFEAEAEKRDDSEAASKDGPEKIANDKTTISRARVMAVTVVPKPAFQECTIQLVDDEPEAEVVPIRDGVYGADVEDGEGDESLVACALVASQIPVTPPADWFTDPGLREPTPLTVTDDGRVFGHIAAWHVDHIGLPFGTKPPRSRSDYAYFHTGVVRTDNGKDVPVGQLTLSGGHAPLDLTADAAVKHYDDTHSAVADVHAGEDAFGIWVAGALRPDVDAAKIRTLRASAPSGDWRPIQGRLELVAVCQVNVPGFPIARARVASGYVTALVAAGAQPLAELKNMSASERLEALSAKAAEAKARMEPALAARSEALAAQADAARARMASLRSEAMDLSEYDQDTREAYAKKGWAMPDLSYPIANVRDLQNALLAYGRCKDKAKTRRHIMKRARGLSRTDLIPSSWTSASIEERWADARATFTELASKSITASASASEPEEPDLLAARETAIARIAALRADGASAAPAAAPAVEGPVVPGPKAMVTPGNGVQPPQPYKMGYTFQPDEHPRGAEGRFRDVLVRLEKDLINVPDTKNAIRQIKHIATLMDQDEKGKIEDATRSVMEEIDAVANSSEITPEISDNLRAGYAALGEALARMPLPKGMDDATMRWTDLPADLQKLMEDVLTKLKGHVSAESYQKLAGPVLSYKSGVDYASADQIQSWMTGMVQQLLDG